MTPFFWIIIKILLTYQMKAPEKIISYVDEIFPPEDIPGYQVKKIIGRGSYGHVAKAVNKNFNELVAIKKISGLSNSLP